MNRTFSNYLPILLAVLVFSGVLVAALMVPQPSTRQPKELILASNYERALELAKEAQKPVMVDFTAAWCGFCTKLDEVTFVHPAVRTYLHENAIVVKVDYDKRQDLARKYNVASLPMILFVSPDGKQMGAPISGFVDPQQFLMEARMRIGG
ncbi:MAG: thioredoxin family protein [Gemmataceae bacterium]